MKKLISILLVIFMIMSLISGCTKSTDIAEAEKEKPEEITETTEKPKEPSILVFNAAVDPPTLDPQLNTISNGSLIIYNMFEGLVRTNTRNEQVPGVAEKWEISEDGKEYKFFIRNDAKWSDGKPVTAYDFEYAWKRAINPENNVKYVNHMFYLENAKAIFNGEKQIEELGVKVIDEKTIVVTLEAPVPYMLEMFSFGVYKPVREDIIKKNPDNWTTDPSTCISNGPFKMVEYKMNDRISLVKDENYWDSDRVKLEQLQFVFVEEEGTALSAFQAGDIDGLLNMPTQQIPSLMMESDEFYIRPRLRITYAAFNVTKFPFDNPKVREAFVKSIDRKQITDTVILTGETPATGFVPAGLIVNGKDFRAEGGDFGIQPTAQIEEAQKALAEAGFPNGEGWPENVEYLYNSNDLNKKIAEALQEMWKKNLNVDVALVNVESKVHSERRHNGDFQIARAGWGADYNHPMTFLDLFTSEAGNNTPQYRVPEYDALITQAKLSTNPVESIEFLHKAEEMFMNDWAVCPISYATQPIMMKSYVKNWDVGSLGDINFDEIYIEK